MQLGPVRSALARLLNEGLDRHEAVHAISSVLSEHMRQLMMGECTAPDPNVVYFAALDQLSATSWRREFGLDDPAV